MCIRDSPITVILLLFGLTIVALVTWGVVASNRLTQVLRGLPDFTASYWIRGFGIVPVILALDSQRRKIAMLTHNVPPRVIGFEDLLGVDVVLTGGAVATKTSGGSIARRAIVGGLIAGPLGAAVGGVTAKSKTVEKPPSVSVRLTINDANAPLFTIGLGSNQAAADDCAARLRLAQRGGSVQHGDVSQHEEFRGAGF